MIIKGESREKDEKLEREVATKREKKWRAEKFWLVSIWSSLYYLVRGSKPTSVSLGET